MRDAHYAVVVLLFGELQDDVAAVSSNGVVLFVFAEDRVDIEVCSA